MAKFTLLELHLEESSFSANAPFSGGESAVESSRTDESAGSNGRRGVAVLVGLVFLLVVALVARRYLGDDEEIDLE